MNHMLNDHFSHSHQDDEHNSEETTKRNIQRNVSDILMSKNAHMFDNDNGHHMHARTQNQLSCSHST